MTLNTWNGLPDPKMPAQAGTEQERAEFTDGAWYWVEKEGWHDEPPKIAPAMYRADCDAWYSWEFSGISTEYLKVLEPCVRHEQAARRAPVVAVPQEALALLRWAEFLLATSAPMTSQQKEAWPSLQKASDEMRAYQASMLAAAPQPPEQIQPKVCKTEIQTIGCNDHIEQPLEMVAAPVQLPEPEFWIVDSQQHGREFMDAAQFKMRSFDAASFKKLYTEPQVLQHVAALEFQLGELAMLTRMLIRALRKVAPENKTAARAVDYLKRKGLTGNPLRGTFPGMQEAKNAPSPATQLCLSDAQCDSLITALCPDFSDESFPGDREVLRNMAREALATNEACICLTPEQVQAQLIEAKDDLYKSRIGMSCSQCASGVYVADGNGYHDFHRCNLCRHCPMWSSDGSEFVAGKTPL